MGFKDIVASLATRLAKARARPDLAEEATKNAVVLPFLSALGFNSVPRTLERACVQRFPTGHTLQNIR